MSANTVDRLMDVAEAAIRQRGFHAVSFRDLAAELGVKSASVHYHFRTKEDLGVALVERYGKEITAALNAWEGDAATGFFMVHKQAMDDDGRLCLCAMLGAESCGLPDGVARAVRAYYERNLNWLIEKLGDKARASQVFAAAQGAMILALTLDDHQLFDQAMTETTGS
ncbi:MAG: TetR/AcrR family transcriptional regulator [Pikeienuella sp.]